MLRMAAAYYGWLIATKPPHLYTATVRRVEERSLSESMPRKWTESLATRSLRYWARLKYISASAWLGVKVRAIIDDVQACYRSYDQYTSYNISVYVKSIIERGQWLLHWILRFPYAAAEHGRLILPVVSHIFLEFLLRHEWPRDI